MENIELEVISKYSDIYDFQDKNRNFNILRDQISEDLEAEQLFSDKSQKSSVRTKESTLKLKTAEYLKS